MDPHRTAPEGPVVEFRESRLLAFGGILVGIGMAGLALWLWDHEFEPRRFRRGAWMAEAWPVLRYVFVVVGPILALERGLALRRHEVLLRLDPQGLERLGEHPLQARWFLTCCTFCLQAEGGLVLVLLPKLWPQVPQVLEAIARLRDSGGGTMKVSDLPHDVPFHVRLDGLRLSPMALGARIEALYGVPYLESRNLPGTHARLPDPRPMAVE